LQLYVNGQQRSLDICASESLLGALRREVGILSVRETCGLGVCGACTLLVDGKLVSGCLLRAAQAQGRTVQTVEGMSTEHPVLRAFESTHPFQCGFCTPGMVLVAKQLLEEIPDPTEAQIRTALGGNLCRCGCYDKIVDAVRAAVS
jgi:aerobic-type carbon monoxide dehydrogenase small subunit (CoxS/CutS family)